MKVRSVEFSTIERESAEVKRDYGPSTKQHQASRQLSSVEFEENDLLYDPRIVQPRRHATEGGEDKCF